MRESETGGTDGNTESAWWTAFEKYPTLDFRMAEK